MKNCNELRGRFPKTHGKFILSLERCRCKLSSMGQVNELYSLRMAGCFPNWKGGSCLGLDAIAFPSYIGSVITASQMQQHALNAHYLLRYLKVEKEKELIHRNEEWAEVTIVMGWNWEMPCNLWSQATSIQQGNHKDMCFIIQELEYPSCYAIISGIFSKGLICRQREKKDNWKRKKKGGRKVYPVEKIYSHCRFC